MSRWIKDSARVLWWKLRKTSVWATKPRRHVAYSETPLYNPLTENKVSVIIPTYNRADLIIRAVRSVLNQTYKNIELIVVDDGSTDDTAKILSSITDDRLTVVQGKHAGVSAARNTGIERSSGSLIAFLDSDDEFLPEKIEMAIAAFNANPAAVMAHSHWVETTMRDGQRVMRPYASGDARHALLMFAPISITTAVIRKRAVDKKTLRLDLSLRVCEDYDMLFRVATQGEIALIKRPLTRVYIHEANTARSPEEVMAAQMYIIKKAFEGSTNGLNRRAVYERNAKAYRRIDNLVRGKTIGRNL